MLYLWSYGNFFQISHIRKQLTIKDQEHRFNLLLVNFSFFLFKVQDVSLPLLKRFGVKNVPALIGRTVNGEVQLLKDGISVKDLKSGIKELKTLLESFEKKNKKLASEQAKKPAKASEPKENKIPILSASNFEETCGEKAPVCIIGVFKSNKAKEKLESILSEVCFPPPIWQYAEAWTCLFFLPSYIIF